MKTSYKIFGCFIYETTLIYWNKVLFFYFNTSYLDTLLLQHLMQMLMSLKKYFMSEIYVYFHFTVISYVTSYVTIQIYASRVT